MCFSVGRDRGEVPQPTVPGHVLKRLEKKNKILTIHSLVTPRQDKLREIMVKKEKSEVGKRGG